MVTAAGTAQVFHLIPLHRSVCPVSKSAANVLCFFISPKYFLLFFIREVYEVLQSIMNIATVAILNEKNVNWDLILQHPCTKSAASLHR